MVVNRGRKGRKLTGKSKATKKMVNIPLKTRRTLEGLYYDVRSPVAYAGLAPLIKAAKEKGIAPKVTKEWSQGESTYTLHKPMKRPSERSRVKVHSIDEQWQADLVDIQAQSKYNSGYNYLLTVIDLFSKYAWVVPLKDKTGLSLIKAFKTIFQRKEHRKPISLQTDAGIFKRFSNTKE